MEETVKIPAKAKKAEAESLTKISIASLRKQLRVKEAQSLVVIVGKHSFGMDVSPQGEYRFIRFVYSQPQIDRSMLGLDYKIPLTTTPCNYGGVRYWFVCQSCDDIRECNRRVGVLYKGEKYFACRHCLKIAYKSQSLSGIWKKFGVVNGPEIDRQIWDWRWHQYKGKRTKRAIKLWKKYDKAVALMATFDKERDKRIRKAQERTQKLIPKIREGWKKKMEMEKRKMLKQTSPAV